VGTTGILEDPNFFNRLRLEEINKKSCGKDCSDEIKQRCQR
jgi:hypothetical protein